VCLDLADEVFVASCARRKLLTGVEDVDFGRLSSPITVGQRLAERTVVEAGLIQK